jgi:pimeloyl-ACP methyl ester carboxylesterase
VARVALGNVEIEVEGLGPEGAPPLLLLMGLGGQLVRWDEDFCALLVARGLRVYRYDHRDIGLSTKLDAFGAERVREALAALRRGEVPELPYRLEDMADDAAALIEALGLGSAHVAGVSMGGMISQLLALRHPARVRSLASIMSTTGDRSLPPPTPEAMAILMTPAPGEREAHIAYQVRSTRVLHGGGLPLDDAYVRRRAAREFDRAYHPLGVARQLLASMAQPSRRAALGSLRLPALVVHGDEDPLIRLEAGLDTHRSIPGSELRVIRGMGHYLAPAAWAELVPALADHALRAESLRSA